MIWLPLILPVVLIIVLLVYFRNRVLAWEVLIPILGTTLIIVFFRFIGIMSVLKDTEYFGNYVYEIRYYEDWNQYIHKTCSSTTRVGKTSITTYYDCSYVQYHPKKWTIITDNNVEHQISYEYWKEIKNKFNTPDQFVELNRPSYTKDGDLYKNKWSGDKKSFVFYGTEHSYENRIQASTSIFNFEDISEEEKIEYKLYDYPNVDNKGQLPAILHTSKYKITKDDQHHFNWINGYLGHKKQVRVWVLLFDGKKTSAKKQESYWKGGNKNELIICIGVDKTLNTKWVHVFGWSKNSKIKIEIRDFIIKQKSINFELLSNFVFEQILNNWERMSFKEFEYIAVEPPLWAYILCWIFSILSVIVSGVWIVYNEYHHD